MRLPWKRIANVLGYIAPLVGGPVGAIYTAISTAVSAIERTVQGQSGATKKQKGMALAGTLLTIAEDRVGVDLVQDELVMEAMSEIMDLEVAVNNAVEELEEAKDALATLVADIQAKREERERA